MAKTPEKTAKPDDVRKQLDDLAAELREVVTVAHARWKIVAVLALIVCVLAGFYVAALYRRTRSFLRPESLVAYAADELREGVKDSDGWSERLKERAPEMANSLEPWLLEIKKDLPGQREQAAEFLRTHAPWLTDAVGDRLKVAGRELPARREALATRLLERAPQAVEGLRPKGCERLRDRVPGQKHAAEAALKRQAPEIADAVRDEVAGSVLPWLMDRWIDEVLDEAAQDGAGERELAKAAVDRALAAHMRDIAALEGDELAAKLQPAFERAAAPALERLAEVAEGEAQALARDLQDTVDRALRGERLNPDEHLVLRAIQLWKTYWNVRADGG